MQIYICDVTSINEVIIFLSSKYSHIDLLSNKTYPKSKNYDKRFFEIDMTDFNDF